MGPATAIKTCLAKSFQFKGRASRSEFGGFAPFWSLANLMLLFAFSKLPIATSYDSTLYLLILTLFSIPIWSAGARRMQDTGLSGLKLLFPFLPFVITCAALLLYFVMPTNESGAMPKIANYVLGICFLTTIVTGMWNLSGLVRIGETIGRLMVSSEPNTNKYGPNPHEVPS